MKTHTYKQAFLTLDKALYGHRNLWQPQVFFNDEPEWQQTHRTLYQNLLSLDMAQVEHLASNSQSLSEWFSPLSPQLVSDLYGFDPKASKTRPISLKQFDHVGVPGRKWRQITAFSAALPHLQGEIIEWCAGKGHLSRVLQRSHQQTVHCLEYNAALCEAGQKLAHKQGYDIHYCHHDVLQPLPQQYQQEGYNHIGLHACGELHMQLLTTAAATNAHSIALSPCCYHKINSTHYTALSTTGQQAQLTPSKPDLHLPQEETRTAGARIKKLRDKEQHWRLAFDCLQQHILQQTTYQPIPSTHKSLFNEDFQYFCQWAASTCHLTLPLNIDYQHFLGIGLKRLERVRKLELLRLLFKRPLELWLALDKILFLEEQGYDAQLTQFCPPDASPRNLLIMAHTLQR